MFGGSAKVFTFITEHSSDTTRENGCGLFCHEPGKYSLRRYDEEQWT